MVWWFRLAVATTVLTRVAFSFLQPPFRNSQIVQNKRLHFDASPHNDDSQEDPSVRRVAMDRREFVSRNAGLLTGFHLLQEPGNSLVANAAEERITKQKEKAAAAVVESLPSLIPFSSRRDYKDLVLPTGLRVLLVHDKQAIRASAALTIGNAGQFDEPPAIGGLAHLTEHMVSSTSQDDKIDFEDWLDDRDGGSNAYTGPSVVCYHFNVPPEVLQEALERFAWMFHPELVAQTCRNEAALKREIRRVNSELDFDDTFDQAFYLTKSVVNKAHPFSRFTQGSTNTLDRMPSQAGINVGEEIIRFFNEHYLASNAVLTVVAPVECSTLQKWVMPFTKALSTSPPPVSNNEAADPSAKKYPEIKGSRKSQFVLYRPAGILPKPQTEYIETLTMEWMLDREYRSDGFIITSTVLGFFVSQIIARRGPGSLYLFLKKQGWIASGSQGLPRIKFPIDVSGFQLMRLELALTLTGFANRSAVVAAIYDSLGKDELTMNTLKRYMVVGRLHGYEITPRPPDAIELAVDAQTYGVGGKSGVGVPGHWPLIPKPDDSEAVQTLRRSVVDLLNIMRDPTKAIIIVTASGKAIARSMQSLVDDPIPPLASRRWQTERVTQARFTTDDLTKLGGVVKEWIVGRLETDDLMPPIFNPLIPPALRPARITKEVSLSDGTRRIYYLDSSAGNAVWREGVTLPASVNPESSWQQQSFDARIGSDWELYQSTAGSPPESPRLPLPIMPTEPNCRCCFVVQLLSSRPARATVRDAASAQLWIFSFEDAIQELVRTPCTVMLFVCLSIRVGLHKCDCRRS